MTVGNSDGPACVYFDDVDRMLGAREVGTGVIIEDTVLDARDDLDGYFPGEGTFGTQSSTVLETASASGTGGIFAFVSVTPVETRRCGAAKVEFVFLTERRVGTDISTKGYMGERDLSFRTRLTSVECLPRPL
jgi:hypothetical protein